VDLAARESKHPIARGVRRLFKDTLFRLRHTTTVLPWFLSSRSSISPRNHGSRYGGRERYDVFGRAYEYLLQQFGQNKECAEYITPRHIVDHMVQVISPVCIRTSPIF
jgi:type I restriction enzyme M protein